MIQILQGNRLLIDIYTSTYMLDDQPFPIDSTTFLSQCNRMTRTGLFVLIMAFLRVQGYRYDKEEYIKTYHILDTFADWSYF